MAIESINVPPLGDQVEQTTSEKYAQEHTISHIAEEVEDQHSPEKKRQRASKACLPCNRRKTVRTGGQAYIAYLISLT